MPIIDTTPSIGRGIEGAGKAAVGYQEATVATSEENRRRARDQRDAQESAAKRRELGLRFRGARDEIMARRTARQREDQSRAARLEWLQRRASAETAGRLIDEDPSAPDVTNIMGPLLQQEVGAKLRESGKNTNQAVAARMRDLRTLISRMSPEDAALTLEEQTADLQAQFLQDEQARVVRDIDDAQRIGIFGDEEGGVASFNNLKAIAAKDPMAARTALEAQRQNWANEHAKVEIRNRTLADAQTWLQTAGTMRGVSDEALMDAQALISSFAADPNRDPKEFSNELRAKLFAGGPPKVNVIGIEKPVEDRSGWSRGGYVEDMTPRQRGELLFIAKAIVDKEMAAEKDAGEFGDLLADPDSPAPEKASREQRVQAMMGDLLLMYGWQDTPPEEQFRRMFAADQQDNPDVQAAHARSNTNLERALGEREVRAQAAEQPAWDTIAESNPALSERVLRTFVDMVDQGASETDIAAAITQMGVNPLTIPPEAIEKWTPKEPAEVESESVKKSEDQVAELESYPLATPDEIESARKQGALANEQAAGRRRAAEEVNAIVKSAAAEGYTGVAPLSANKGFEVELEVYARWLERKGDAASKEKAAKIRAHQKESGLRSDWGDDELRKQYTKRRKETFSDFASGTSRGTLQ